MMRASLAILALAAVGVADDGPAARKLEAIKKGHEETEAAFSRALQGLDGKKKEDVEKAERLAEEMYAKQKERYAQALEIAKAGPKSDAGFGALEWLLTNPQVYLIAVGKSAMELATEHHASNPKIAPAVRTLGWVAAATPDNYEAAVAFLKAVLKKNPSRDARGYAARGLAAQAIHRLAVAEAANNPDARKLAAEAQTELEAVLKDHGDIAEVGAWARGELFEIRHLRVGKVAPEIEGEDLDGVKFKLSDYRGKVVVLDFWADW